MKVHFLIPRIKRGFILLICAALLVSGCLPVVPTLTLIPFTPTPVPTATLPLPTPLATRPSYQPGELVSYTAQTGDTLIALSARFNTSIKEILAANPIIPESATTMPAGMPMRIPIYYRPLWGSSYQILPDSLFINGPAQVHFDPVDFANHHAGWLKNYSDWVAGENRSGAEIILYVATNYSISPRLLMAIAEYQLGALTDPSPPNAAEEYPLGKVDYHKTGFYRQLAWAADVLNASYYSWRTGKLLAFDHLDNRLERPDPWQNAATVALQYYFARTLDGEAYTRAISSVGFNKTYKDLFGDPWQNVQAHIPGSLVQPQLNLPFLPGPAWAFTGGPHNAWGEEDGTLAALDFAPPAVVSGCIATEEWATAVAAGTIVRTGVGIAVLDLDNDYDEHTGWVIFYLHLETTTIPPVGTHLNTGDPIGHPSCEGGVATGTHVHIARKYNGEWILAGGTLAFNLEGWVASNGSAPYLGTLSHPGRTISACVCSDQASQLQSSSTTTIAP
jgi:LasA protease